MQPSKFQQAVLDAVENTTDNLIISAVAGSGKTTLLRMIADKLRDINPFCKILYLAYNNEIVKEVEPKLKPLGVTVKTFHSYGKQAITSFYPKAEVNQYKYQNFMKQYEDEFKPVNSSQMKKICEILRIWCVPLNAENFLKAFDHWGIELDDSWFEDNLENFVSAMSQIIVNGCNDTTKIDFVDMLLFPVRNKLTLAKYDIILVDEAQDLSRIMHLMIKSCMKNGSRIISVGDEKQAIYEFAGADSDSFRNLKQITNAVEYPLSVCYRCFDGAIEYAQKYVPHIEGTGKTGKLDLNFSYSAMLSQLQNDDLIICRYNAPLLRLAFRLLANNRRVKMKGRDFSEQLINYIKKAFAENSDFGKFQETLTDIINFQIAKNKENETKVQLLQDILDCLLTIYKESSCQNYKQMIEFIGSIFDDKENTGFISLSSFHRSKGLENNRVYLLYDDRGLSAPDYGQESNLVYVAVTRAKNELLFVKEPSKS